MSETMKRPLLTILLFLLLGAVANVAVAWGCAAWANPTVTEQSGMRFHGEGYNTWVVDRQRARATLHIVSSWVEPQCLISFRAQPAPSPQSLIPPWADFLKPSCDARGHLHLRIASAHGWPLLSLWSAEKQTVSGPSNRLTRQILSGFALPVDENHRVRAASKTQFAAASRIVDFLESLHSAHELAIAIAPEGLKLRVVDLSVPPAWPQSLLLAPLAPLWPGFATNTLFYAAILWLLIPGLFALRHMIRRWRGLCPKCAYPMGESSVCTECGQGLPQPVRARMARVR